VTDGLSVAEIVDAGVAALRSLHVARPGGRFDGYLRRRHCERRTYCVPQAT
jgi:hypothetical protein